MGGNAKKTFMGRFMGILNQGKHEAIDGMIRSRHGTVSESIGHGHGHGPGIKHLHHKPSFRDKR